MIISKYSTTHHMFFFFFNLSAISLCYQCVCGIIRVLFLALIAFASQTVVHNTLEINLRLSSKISRRVITALHD